MESIEWLETLGVDPGGSRGSQSSTLPFYKLDNTVTAQNREEVTRRGCLVVRIRVGRPLGPAFGGEKNRSTVTLLD